MKRGDDFYGKWSSKQDRKNIELIKIYSTVGIEVIWKSSKILSKQLEVLELFYTIATIRNYKENMFLIHYKNGGISCKDKTVKKE